MNPEIPHGDEVHKATTGYNTAIQLMTYEGNLIWSRYSAMLVANTIIFTLVSASLTTNWQMPELLVVALPVAGICLCLIWHFLTKRGFDYYRYWIMSARELEERFLAPTVTTLKRGAPYAAGKEVEIQLDGKLTKIQMRPESRDATAEVLAYGPIQIFTILYVIELVILWHRFTP